MSCLNRFKGWCQENFPFIEDDFNAITDYQLMCKLKEYVVSIGNDVANLEIDYNELAGKIVELEEIVNNMDGEFDDLVEEFNSLKTLVESYNMRIIANANRIEQVNTNLQQLISLNINEVKDLINELKDYVDREDTLILADISTINENIVLIRKDIEVIAEAIPKVRDTGTIITLNDTIKDAHIDIKLDPSELSQDADPTPDSPQNVHVISGDNSIKASNQLFDMNWLQATGIEVSNGVATGTAGNFYNNFYKDNSFIPNTNYGNKQISISMSAYNDSDGSITSNGLLLQINYTDNTYDRLIFQNSDITKTTKTITSNSSKEIKNISFSYISQGAYIWHVSEIMIVEGDTPKEYIPYQEQVKPLNLGNIEYCKIGTYADKFFKAIDGDSIYDTLDSTTKESLTSGKWYIQKNIGKYTLPNNIGGYNQSANWYYFGLPISINTTTLFCNYLKYYEHLIGGDTTEGIAYSSNYGNLLIRNNNCSSTEDYRSWLGTHNIILYYVSATPTYIPLNDTLQQQLDDIYETLKAYNDQTNITQINHDLPFIMTAITMKKGSVTDEV